MKDTEKEVLTDSQGRPIFDSDWGCPAEKVVTYTVSGDGATGALTLFTVTGTVIMRIFGVVETALETDASGTLSVGVTDDTAKLIALVNTVAKLIAGEIYHDADPDAFIELTSVLEEYIVANGKDVIQTIATGAVKAGKMRFICLWYPLSADGKVVPA